MILKRINPNIQGEFTNIFMDKYGIELTLEEVNEYGINNHSNFIKYYKFKSQIIEVTNKIEEISDSITKIENFVIVKSIFKGNLINEGLIS